MSAGEAGSPTEVCGVLMQMRPPSPGPPAYTNARPLAQPLRFGAAPMHLQGRHPYSSIPQNPVRFLL